VSRCINTPHLVAPATAARVLRVIESLGYRPNRFAQGLMTRRSHTLGVVLPDIHGEFYSELLRGANAEARRHKYHLLVTSGAPGVDGTETVDSGTFGLVDGLALMITEPNEALWRAARRTGLPIVALDSDPDGERVDSVLIDNASGAREAARHLLESVPPQRCYFVGGPRDNFDTGQRAGAFDSALKGAAHEPRADQLAFGEYSPEWGRRWAEGWVRSEGGAAGRGKEGGGIPIGVMAGNDEIAYGVMDGMQAAGRNVPRDVRVVGFDDSRLASLVRPALSTVRVPLAEVGAVVVDTLIQRIQHPERKVVSRMLMTRLVVRGSSG
jgi:LacI family transcriptional regulator